MSDTTKYLYYESGKSEVTISKKLLDAHKFEWNHKDTLFLSGTDYDSLRALKISKKGPGHLTKYLYYEKTKKSTVTIPKELLEAERIDWKHGDTIYIVTFDVEGQGKWLYLYKQE